MLRVRVRDVALEEVTFKQMTGGEVFSHTESGKWLQAGDRQCQGCRQEGNLPVQIEAS